MFKRMIQLDGQNYVAQPAETCDGCAFDQEVNGIVGCALMDAGHVKTDNVCRDDKDWTKGALFPMVIWVKES